MFDSSYLTSVNKQVGETNRWLRQYQADKAATDAETEVGDNGNSSGTDFPWSDLLNTSGTSGMMMPMLMLMLLQMMIGMMQTGSQQAQADTQGDPFQGFPVYWPNGPRTSLVPPVLNPFEALSQNSNNV